MAYSDAQYSVIERTWFGLHLNKGGCVAAAAGYTCGAEAATSNNHLAAYYPKGPIRLLKFGVMVQKAVASNEQTNSTNTWETALELVSGPLEAGEYEVGFSCEIAQLNADVNSGVQARVLYNGSEAQSMVANFNIYDVRSASTPVTVDNFDAPIIEIQFRRIGTSNTARIRRCRLSITPIYDNGE